MDHNEIIKLIIAYTLTGAIVFTVVITCISLLGWVKFADGKQQRKLFTILIVELVIVAVAFFADFLQFNPKEVKDNIEAKALSEAEIERMDQMITESAASFDYWMKNYNHPENVSDNRELLDWIYMDSGAEKIAGDYEVFKKLAKRLSEMNYKTNPPPLESEFKTALKENETREEMMKSAK